MINTVVIVVKRFGTSSKHFLLRFYLNLADIIHCNLNDFISFHLVFFVFVFFGFFFVFFCFFLSIKITLKIDFGKSEYIVENNIYHQLFAKSEFAVANII